MSEHSLVTYMRHLRAEFARRRRAAEQQSEFAEQDDRQTDCIQWCERAETWRTAINQIDSMLACAGDDTTPTDDKLEAIEPEPRIECDCLDRDHCLKSGQPCDAAERGGCAEADEIADSLEFPSQIEHRPGVGVMLDKLGRQVAPAAHYTVTAMDRIRGQRVPYAHVATLDMAYAVAGLLTRAGDQHPVEIWRKWTTDGEQHFVGRVSDR